MGRYSGTLEFCDGRMEGSKVNHALLKDSRTSPGISPMSLFDVLRLHRPCKLQGLPLASSSQMGRFGDNLLARQRHAVVVCSKSSSENFSSPLAGIPPFALRKLAQDGSDIRAFASARNRERAFELANKIPCNRIQRLHVLEPTFSRNLAALLPTSPRGRPACMDYETPTFAARFMTRLPLKEVLP